MRKAVRTSWARLAHLESALRDAKAMELPEGQSIAEEVSLIEAQIAKLTQAVAERKQKIIQNRYSMTSERLSMGEFVLTRVLNNDPETKKIWLLGRFQKDPTDN